MKLLISFSVISLFLLSGISGRDTNDVKPETKAIEDKLCFDEDISKPSESLVKQAKQLEESLSHAESEIMCIKEIYMQRPTLVADTIAMDTLVEKKRFFRRMIDKIK